MNLLYKIQNYEAPDEIPKNFQYCREFIRMAEQQRKAKNQPANKSQQTRILRSEMAKTSAEKYLEENFGRLTFAKALKAERTTAGLTQQELADKIGVTKQAISKFEKGVDFPSADTVRKIAKPDSNTRISRFPVPDARFLERSKAHGRKFIVKIFANPFLHSQLMTFSIEKSISSLDHVDHFRFILPNTEGGKSIKWSEGR